MQFLVTSASLHRLLVLGVERCRMSHLAAHGDGTATRHMLGAERLQCSCFTERIDQPMHAKARSGVQGGRGGELWQAPRRHTLIVPTCICFVHLLCFHASPHLGGEHGQHGRPARTYRAEAGGRPALDLPGALAGRARGRTNWPTPLFAAGFHMVAHAPEAVQDPHISAHCLGVGSGSGLGSGSGSQGKGHRVRGSGSGSRG